MNGSDDWGRVLAKRPGERRWVTALTLSIAGGFLGLDRFYMGQIPMGMLKLVTFGLGGVWWLIDVVLIALRLVKDVDGQELG